MNNETTTEPPSIDLSIAHQIKDYDGFLPTDNQFSRWINQALISVKPHAEIALVIVDKIAMQQYNSQYRNKNKATNVLSFPAEVPEGVEHELLGDILVCPDIINQEASELQINPCDHWTHIIIHGVLHLLGYDHMNEKDAEIMETEEIRLLTHLGVKNPYE